MAWSGTARSSFRHQRRLWGAEQQAAADTPPLAPPQVDMQDSIASMEHLRTAGSAVQDAPQAASSSTGDGAADPAAAPAAAPTPARDPVGPLVEALAPLCTTEALSALSGVQLRDVCYRVAALLATCEGANLSTRQAARVQALGYQSRALAMQQCVLDELLARMDVMTTATSAATSTSTSTSTSASATPPQTPPPTTAAAISLTAGAGRSAGFGSPPGELAAGSARHTDHCALWLECLAACLGTYSPVASYVAAFDAKVKQQDTRVQAPSAFTSEAAATWHALPQAETARQAMPTPLRERLQTALAEALTRCAASIAAAGGTAVAQEAVALDAAPAAGSESPVAFPVASLRLLTTSFAAVAGLAAPTDRGLTWARQAASGLYYLLRADPTLRAWSGMQAPVAPEASLTAAADAVGAVTAGSQPFASAALGPTERLMCTLSLLHLHRRVSKVAGVPVGSWNKHIVEPLLQSVQAGAVTSADPRHQMPLIAMLLHELASTKVPCAALLAHLEPLLDQLAVQALTQASTLSKRLQSTSSEASSRASLARPSYDSAALTTVSDDSLLRFLRDSVKLTQWLTVVNALVHSAHGRSAALERRLPSVIRSTVTTASALLTPEAEAISRPLVREIQSRIDNAVKYFLAVAPHQALHDDAASTTTTTGTARGTASRSAYGGPSAPGPPHIAGTIGMPSKLRHLVAVVAALDAYVAARVAAASHRARAGAAASLSEKTVHGLPAEGVTHVPVWAATISSMHFWAAGALLSMSAEAACIHDSRAFLDATRATQRIVAEVLAPLRDLSDEALGEHLEHTFGTTHAMYVRRFLGSLHHLYLASVACEAPPVLSTASGLRAIAATAPAPAAPAAADGATAGTSSSSADEPLQHIVRRLVPHLGAAGSAPRREPRSKVRQQQLKLLDTAVGQWCFERTLPLPSLQTLLEPLGVVLDYAWHDHQVAVLVTNEPALIANTGAPSPWCDAHARPALGTPPPEWMVATGADIDGGASSSPPSSSSSGGAVDTVLDFSLVWAACRALASMGWRVVFVSLADVPHDDKAAITTTTLQQLTRAGLWEALAHRADHHSVAGDGTGAGVDAP